MRGVQTTTLTQKHAIHNRNTIHPLKGTNSDPVGSTAAQTAAHSLANCRSKLGQTRPTLVKLPVKERDAVTGEQLPA